MTFGRGQFISMMGISQDWENLNLTVRKPVFGPLSAFYPPILHHGSLATVFSNQSNISGPCPLLLFYYDPAYISHNL